MNVLSKENRKGTCSICSDNVHKMAFVKHEGNYDYVCLDCIGEGESERDRQPLKVERIDEAKVAREDMLDILIELAEEDEVMFEDPRLAVVNHFRDDIVEGNITKQLDQYIRFNGNPIEWVLAIRSLAFEAVKHRGEKFQDIIHLYIECRVRKLSRGQENQVKILLADKEIQLLNEDYKLVWENYGMLYDEIMRDASRRRYDHVDELRGVIEFIEKKGYATDFQMKRLKSFYYEMLRRKSA